jgi:hypothetical protein
MSRLLLALIVLLVALTAFAPPGLCPCWLYLHVEEYHPHSPGQATHPHSHTYLHELYQSQTAAAVPVTLLPAALFILLLAGGLGARRLPHAAADGAGWNRPTEVPPPRLSLLTTAA